MEKIKKNAGWLISLLFLLLLTLQCGKKGETKHYRYIGTAEWSPVSENAMIVSKDEFDETVGATSGCGSEPAIQNLRSPEYFIYLTDTGETKFKLLGKNFSALMPHQIKWSPIGNKFILFGGRVPTIYIIDTAGSLLITDSLGYTFDADWSPDGSKIVCSALRGSQLNPSLQIIDASTGLCTRLLPDTVSTGAVAWSVNNQIAFAFSHDTTTMLATINESGTNLVILDSAAFYNNLRWSPNGNILGYSKHFENEYDVYLRNVSTSSLQHLLHFADNTQIASLRFSPDGNKLSYYLYRTASSTYLYIMNLSDQSVQQIATDCTDGSWSPDSKQIAYVYYNEIFFKPVQ
ncbi:MAG: DPP IV N-terminal domain-containing protein [Ignavibacteriales bacterium]|nr:DPP IV N-terminal domain-containing protein [Ignavibacteriales bacterium]